MECTSVCSKTPENLYLVYISDRRYMTMMTVVANGKRAKWSPSCLYFQTEAEPVYDYVNRCKLQVNGH